MIILKWWLKKLSIIHKYVACNAQIMIGVFPMTQDNVSHIEHSYSQYFQHAWADPQN